MMFYLHFCSFEGPKRKPTPKKQKIIIPISNLPNEILITKPVKEYRKTGQQKTGSVLNQQQPAGTNVARPLSTPPTSEPMLVSAFIFIIII